MAEGKTKIYYGWWILLICFILMFLGHAARSSLYSFLPPIKDEFGWSISQVAGSFGITSLLGFIAGLAVAPLIDRIGPRRFILTGFPLIGIGFVLLSFTNASWMLYIVSLLVGLGFGIALFIAPHTVIVHWLKKRRCFTLALLLSGSVLGASLIKEPAIENVISSVNWDWTALGIGLVTIVICVPLTLMIKNKPERSINSVVEKQEDNREEAYSEDKVSSGIDFSVREALKNKAFWLLTFAMALAGIAQVMASNATGLLLFMEMDIPRESMADISRFTPWMSLSGILIFGYFGDRYPKRYLLALAVAIQSISVIILMTAGSITQIYIYRLVLGLGSGTIPLMFAIRADYFGLRHFATIAAIMIFVSSIIGLAPGVGLVFLSNWIYDVTDSYHSVYIISIFVGLIPAVIYFFARPPKMKGAT